MGKSKQKEEKKVEAPAKKEEPLKKAATPTGKPQAKEGQPMEKPEGEAKPLIPPTEGEAMAKEEMPNAVVIKDWDTWHTSTQPFEEKVKVLKEKPELLFSAHKSLKTQKALWLGIIPKEWQEKILAEYTEASAKMEEIVDCEIYLGTISEADACGSH